MNSLQEGNLSKLMVDFPLFLLHNHDPSHELKEVHLKIRERFRDILSKEFKPVPCLPEFFFYYPQHGMPFYQVRQFHGFILFYSVEVDIFCGIRIWELTYFAG